VLKKQPHHTTDLPPCRWASFYLVIGLIETLGYVRAGLSLLPAQHWLAMAVYITGLITQENVTVTALAMAVGVVSHDQLSRMLASLRWGMAEGAILAVRFVEALGWEGYLVVDDVLIPKPFASQIAFCFWDHDHSLKRHTFGQRLVFVVWSNGWLTIPLLFAFWQKSPKPAVRKRRRKRGRPPKRGRPITDYSKRALRRRTRYRARQRALRRRLRLANGVHVRSKNELARCLVWTVVRRGIRAQFILFDNWYASRENLALFERLGLYWVTRAKENARVSYAEQRLSVKQVASIVKKANYHYYSALGARVRSFQVTWVDRLVKLTVLKDDTAPERGRTKYLMTNALHLTNQEHIQWYRCRWVVEVFFRDTKQYLGLAKCEARTPEAVISHVALVCLAYTFLQVLKPLHAQDRPSIRASKNALAPLLVVAMGERRMAKPHPTGALEFLSFDHLWHPARTRFPDLPCPNLFGFS
jgi:hypothetical protein